jgi:hypothetical protein
LVEVRVGEGVFEVGALNDEMAPSQTPKRNWRARLEVPKAAVEEVEVEVELDEWAAIRTRQARRMQKKEARSARRERALSREAETTVEAMRRGDAERGWTSVASARAFVWSVVETLRRAIWPRANQKRAIEEKNTVTVEIKNDEGKVVDAPSAPNESPVIHSPLSSGQAYAAPPYVSRFSSAPAHNDTWVRQRSRATRARH